MLPPKSDIVLGEQRMKIGYCRYYRDISISVTALKPEARWATAGTVTRSGARKPNPSGVRLAGGEATPPITGGWDHGWSGWSGSLAVSRLELLSAGALPTRSFVPSESTMWYGSEGLHQAVAPAIGV